MTTPPEQPGFPPPPPYQGYGTAPPGFGPPQPFPQYGQQPGQPWQGYPSGPSNGFGTAALVLGIVSLVIGLVPLAFFLAVPLGIVGIVFGVLGRRRATRGEATNGGMATAGLVCAILGIVASAIWVSALVFEVGSTSCRSTTVSSDGGESYSVGC